MNHYLERYRNVLEKISRLDLKDITINADFSSLENEKAKYERLRKSLYLDLEDELITSEEFERYRKNYLFKIKQIEEQIMTEQEVVRELEKRLKDKESFISNVIPSKDLDEVTRAMLITFIDKVEVLENSQINFVFNNIDIVNLLEKLVEKNKATNAKKSAKPISLHQAYAKIDPTPRYVSVGGGM